PPIGSAAQPEISHPSSGKRISRNCRTSRYARIDHARRTPLANSPPGMPAREPTIEQWENPVRFPDRDNGHRELGDPAALVPAIREAVRRLLDLLPEHAESAVALMAVSSLVLQP